MTDFDITEPCEGKVTLTLSWDDAEILVRALGMVNSGNLDSVSPDLGDFARDMIAKVGRNVQNEARKYYSYTQPSMVGQQVYVDLVTNW